MDFGQLFNTILDLIVGLLMIIPQFINWVLVQLVDLLLLMWPSSTALGLPSVVDLLNQVAAAYPFFPWGTIAQALTIGLGLLGLVAIWKVVDLVWP